MDDISRKKEAIRNLYGPDWDRKVKKMSDSQVVAIYMRFKREGKI